MSILSVKEVVKRFGGVVALDRVSIDVEENTITLLIGPNGSGKSTLLNVVSGVYKPDSGRVLFKGIDITGRKPHEIYKLGIARTFQVPQVYPKLSVLENVLLGACDHPGESVSKALFKKAWVKKEVELIERAYRLLELVGLDGLWHMEAGKLSGGQLRLLEIARALMSDAKLILMDEPAAGLNPTIAHEIFRHLAELKHKLGVTFLIVEHRLDIALEYADYAYAMAYGRVISHGPPSKVINDPVVIDAYLGG